jgi:hypothetical protein
VALTLALRRSSHRDGAAGSPGAQVAEPVELLDVRERRQGFLL